MKNLILVIGFGLLLIGCGEKYDPNLAQNPTSTDVAKAKDRKSELIAIYKRAGGDWNKMTPEDKKRLLELSNGDESMAQQGWPFLGKMAE